MTVEQKCCEYDVIDTSYNFDNNGAFGNFSHLTSPYIQMHCECCDYIFFTNGASL